MASSGSSVPAAIEAAFAADGNGVQPTSRGMADDEPGAPSSPPSGMSLRTRSPITTRRSKLMARSSFAPSSPRVRWRCSPTPSEDRECLSVAYGATKAQPSVDVAPIAGLAFTTPAAAAGLHLGHGAQEAPGPRPVALGPLDESSISGSLSHFLRQTIDLAYF